MLSESEWQTRKKRINTRLKALNPAWSIIPHTVGMDNARLHCCAVEEYPTENGPADYALFVHGRLLGIIEAKKVGVTPGNVLEQAKRYSRGATDGAGHWGDYHVPFLYATNGEVVHFIDVREPLSYSRTVSTFHTAGAIEEMFGKGADYNWFAENPIAIAGLRPYQAQAITAVEHAIAQGRRAMLVAMATGTGKTFTTVAQVHRMLESKTIRRILFLVDRRALAAQAVREFGSFDTPAGRKFNQEYDVYHQQFHREDIDNEDGRPFDPKVLPDQYLTAPGAAHTFVYVSTIQRMAINLFGREAVFEDESDGFGEGEGEGDAGKLDIPVHAFDVIIADECHRGYTGQQVGLWRRVIEHFDAIRVGLTATPAAHTVSLFGEPTFRYTTDEAIQDGYLVDYEAVKISSKVRIEGVFLKEGELVALRDRKTGQEVLDYLEDEREFAKEDVERKITVPDSNRQIVRELAVYARAHEQQYGRFPKTLIFAANDLSNASHADQLVAMCRQEFARGDAFVQKITGNANVDRPLQRIREFRNRETPKVVVTVDMLSTGVDIPSLEFIVFLRPVKPRILWVQMLGRGTRLCRDIHKTHFTIFDCFDGTLIEYFKGATDFAVDSSVRASLPVAEVIENIYRNFERDYHTKVLVKRLHRINREMSGEAREQFAALGIPDGDLGQWATELPQRLKSEWTGTMALLREPAMQRQLQDYGKTQSFMTAPQQTDTVSSQIVFHVGDKHLQPMDYLEAFERFVRENSEQIAAIRILLGAPRQWNRDALEDLSQQLRRHDFDPESLRRAHRLAGSQAVADIISLVKHAANEEEPLLTAQQRVDRAFAKVTAGKSFTPEQLQWLNRIREHLTENLSLQMEDFEVFPIFDHAGGLGKMKKVFTEPVLQDLVEEFNFAIAA